ncbi:MAG: CPBP family intramembrane metalloprotease [Clostridiales bacterium]|jgi:membrane protease YdiL (CAAX protease family)|nr:CPBP family intramembrane metalloprotease [Clostridiales bacterium]
MGDNMEYKEEDNMLEQNDLDQNELDQNKFEQDEDINEDTVIAMSGKSILVKCGLYLSFMSLAIFAAQFIISFIVASLFPDADETGWFNVVLTLITVVGVGLPIFARLMKGIPDSEIGEKKNISIIKFIGYFIICVATAYISNIVGLFISAIIELIKGIEMINPLEEFIFGSNMIIFALYAVIIAPIVEELVFRKILLDKLRRFGDLPAILITGFAFGIFHFNLAQFFYATVLGILFAYITIRTNRIIYSIVLHMMMNFTGTAFVPLLTKDQNLLGMGIMMIWFYGAMTLGSILLIVSLRKIKLIKPITPLVRKRDYILNPGALLFIAIGIGMIIINIAMA